MRSSRTLVRVLAVAATLAVALTGCSSKGGAQNQAGLRRQRHRPLRAALHDCDGHPRAGRDTSGTRSGAGRPDAAKNLNVDLKYSNNENGPEQATLVQNAIDSKVDGLAVTLFQTRTPSSRPQEAANAGSRVVVQPGVDQYKQAEPRCTSASDEDCRGRASASGSARQWREGALRHPGHRARWHGDRAPREEDLRQHRELYVNGRRQAGRAGSIGAKLQQDKAITHVVTLGAVTRWPR